MDGSTRGGVGFFCHREREKCMWEWRQTLMKMNDEGWEVCGEWGGREGRGVDITHWPGHSATLGLRYLLAQAPSLPLCVSHTHIQSAVKHSCLSWQMHPNPISPIRLCLPVLTSCAVTATVSSGPLLPLLPPNLFSTWHSHKAQNLQGSEGRICPSLSPWLVDDHLHVHTTFSPYSCLSPISPFYKATSHVVLGPTPVTSL